MFSIPHSGIPAPGIAYDWTENVRLAVLKKIGSSLSPLLCLPYSARLTPGPGATVSRVVLFDYRKAFDLDHTILAGKSIALDISHGIFSWIIDFLEDRKQRVNGL